MQGNKNAALTFWVALKQIAEAQLWFWPFYEKKKA